MIGLVGIRATDEKFLTGSLNQKSYGLKIAVVSGRYDDLNSRVEADFTFPTKDGYFLLYRIFFPNRRAIKQIDNIEILRKKRSDKLYKFGSVAVGGRLSARISTIDFVSLFGHPWRLEGGETVGIVVTPRKSIGNVSITAPDIEYPFYAEEPTEPSYLFPVYFIFGGEDV